MKSAIIALLLVIAPAQAFADGTFGGSTSSVGTAFGNASTQPSGDRLNLTITGAAAKALYDKLDVPETSFATGMCRTQPCDSARFTNKRADGISCSRTSFSISPRVDYTCILKLDDQGVLIGG
jgi:hypothetical protein